MAENLSRFLLRLRDVDERLSDWREKWSSLHSAAAQVPIPLTPADLAAHLQVQRTDIGGTSMPQLGYSFAAWNGGGGGVDASVSCTVGLIANNPSLRNHVVLNLPPDLIQPEPQSALLTCIRGVWKPDEVVLLDGTPRRRAVLWPVG